ncbi:hydrogenase expression/formation protein HypE [Candidatus Margulisiibacteriota bacterium]
MTNKQILLDHGSGGKLSHELISSVFVKHFANNTLKELTDSALCKVSSDQIAFTTDSYVVQPIFFPGGDIGKLAVCGTVNDLAVTGATPLYLSCGFIIEEGFSIEELDKIVSSMAKEAKNSGVQIVTGDTKVVERGAADKIFINTAGIGIIDKKNVEIANAKGVQTGDKIIINGPIAEHGVSVLGKRNELDFKTDINSDCASLNELIAKVLRISDKVKFMRDATRGGVATVLCELAENKKLGIKLDEDTIPIKENVRGICEMLGFDPLYVANEGKVVIVIGAEDAEKVLKEMKKDPLGKESAVIGEIVQDHAGKVVLNTVVGGSRIVDMLSGAQLPRIC